MLGRRRHEEASIDGEPDPTEWRALLSAIKPGNQFLSPAWFESWESAYVDTGNWKGPARYMTVRLDGRLAGVLPFAQQKVSVFRFLSAGGYHMPFREFPVNLDDKDRILDAMLRRLRRIRGVVGFRVGPLEGRSSTYEALREALRRNRWAILELERGEILWLELPRTANEYALMIRGRAKKADYFLRKLQKKGDVSIRRRTGLAPPEWQDTLEVLRKIESESWVARRGDPRFLGERNQRFWTQILRDPQLSEAIKVWILHLDGNPISFCLVLDAGPVRYQLINGYSESAKRHSTGHIVFKRMIYDALDTGIERISFGQGDPGHKSEWGAKPSQNLFDLVALKPGLSGKVASAAYLTAQKLRAVRKQLDQDIEYNRLFARFRGA